MVLPTMTPEQRAAASAKAAQVRSERSAMIATIKSGEVGLADILGRSDELARRTRVAQVLRALPGYGPATVARVLAAAGIDDKRRVGALNAAQRESLLNPAR